MALIAPAIMTVSPSFMEPDTIMQYSQTSNAFEMLPGGEPRVKIGSDDLAVYAKRLDLRTKMASGQVAYNMLPTVNPIFTIGVTPTYLARLRYEFDHHDAAAAGRWGHAITDLYRLGSQQAHFQLMRTALIFGISPALGEGLANAAGVTVVNLPADSNGNTTIVTYDNGQMALFLLQLIGAIKNRILNIGLGVDVAVLAPQRVIQAWEYNIVQLVQFQRQGAGTESTAGTVKIVAGYNQDDIMWGCDDTLIGKGSGGSDLIIVGIPELIVPTATNAINTNKFAELTPGMRANIMQYADMIAPREITAPLPGGATDTLTEHRITSGWVIRPEAVTLLNATYQ